MPGSYINFAPLTAGSSSKSTDSSGLTSADNITACFGGIQSNQGLGLSIYGDVFLKSQFVVFDSDNLRLGVAPKAL